jgi:STE24 endopeptidase
MAVGSSHGRWLAPLALPAAAAAAAALVLRPRGGVLRPAAVTASDYFEAADIARARSYERSQRVLAGASSAASALTLTLALRSSRPLQSRQPSGAAADGAVLSLKLALVGLPLGALARERAVAAGLATQSWGGWTVDLLRSATLGAVFSGAAAAGLHLVMRTYGERWWLVAGAGAVAVAGAATFAAPVLIDPIFNEFTPLAPGELHSSLMRLADRAGVNVGDVFSVDASRRTTGVNAYVGGIGATRRVVLFDTLLSTFTPAETNLVVAHELAHVRHHDVRRGLLFTAIVAAPVSHAVARLAERLDAAVGRSEPITLPALALAGATIASLVSPSARQLSRGVERRADSAALELTADTDAFITFEQRITRANLSDPDPPRWRSLFATHPTALERIGAAVAYASGARPATAPTPRRRRRRP